MMHRTSNISTIRSTPPVGRVPPAYSRDEASVFPDRAQHIAHLHRLLLFGLGLICTIPAVGYQYQFNPSDFATEVVDYVQGGPIPLDRILSIPFDQPQTALGRPTIDTTGDNFTIPAAQAVTVVPVYGPLRMYELVSIGEGGHLILAFDHAVENDHRNPCGVDFIVYGNAFQTISSTTFWADGDPNNVVITTMNVAGEPGIVSVAQTHDPLQPELTTWYTFNSPPAADMFAPTLGRRYDPDNAPAGSPNNGWWSDPTHPLIPFNPSLGPADFQGHTLAQYAYKYGHSAGGTGFDLDDIGLDWFQYIRIENPSGSGFTPEIDAIADVDPDAPAPDFDCDIDVDADDLDLFTNCFTGPAIGPPTSGCERMDLDQDDDVDLTDHAIVQRCHTGPDVPADPDCKGF